jgi:hypothetical protein
MGDIHAESLDYPRSPQIRLIWQLRTVAEHLHSHEFYPGSIQGIISELKRTNFSFSS